MHVRLLDSTPFRISILLGALFLTSTMVAGIVAWRLTAAELSLRLDDSIREEAQVIGQTYGDTDLTDLRDSVLSHVNATVEHRRVYLLRSSADEVLAGNIPRANVPVGWSLVDGAMLGLASGTSYRVFSSAVDGNPLLVGASLQENDAVSQILLNSLLLAGGLLSASVVALGTFFAFRGQRRLVEITTAMRRVGQGDLTARVPVSRRQDDIDRVAQQVNVAIERLATLVEGMRQVTVDIAHDLKTPLNRLAITVREAGTMAEGTEIEAMLAVAEEEIDDVSRTFDALLRIAQVEAGSRRSRFAAVDLTGILRQMGELYGDVAEGRGQQVTVDVSTDFPRIRGDRELLTQMFANLVENALKHGGENAKIAIGATAATGPAVVEISDNGPGIPEDEREAVFRRFYRVERSRTTPGTGLGLSLVKAIADLHGASLSLQDNNPGLRVVITFPVGSAS